MGGWVWQYGLGQSSSARSNLESSPSPKISLNRFTIYVAQYIATVWFGYNACAGQGYKKNKLYNE
jgi:hypothetical protein